MHREKHDIEMVTVSASRRGGTCPDGGPRRRSGRFGARIGELVGVLLGLAVAAAALVLLGTVTRRGPAAAARPDDVLLALLAWVGVGLAVWLAVGSLLAVLALLPGTAGRVARQVGERVTPLAVRRCLTLVLGASVGSVALPVAPLSTAGSAPVARDTTAPASETSTASGSSGSLSDPVATPAFVPNVSAPVARRAAAESLDGPGFAPSQPAPPRTPVRTAAEVAGPGYVPSVPPPVLDSERSRLLAPSPRVASATHDLVTVRRGDTLWGLAARHLGAGASDAEVAREWPRWYAANRAVIGDDPDLLVPGQQLRPPGHTAALPSRATAGSGDGLVERGAQR